jgi:hypothetical protein
MSDQFVVLDECFYRPPGIHNLRDIPKSYKIPLETNATFDKHVATVEEAVFEEEKVGWNYTTQVVPTLIQI